MFDLLSDNDVLINEQPVGNLVIATIKASDTGGSKILFDGDGTAADKKYPSMAIGMPAPTSGSRVLVAKIGGSAIVLGEVQSYYRDATPEYIPTLPSSASTSAIITKINAIITALAWLGIITKTSS